jgi:pyrroloquinoline-quinone synthase
VTAGRADFEARLRRTLEERYHHLHPFNRRMHEGRLSEGEIRTWVRNRYYYQTRIPVKDGLILAKAADPRFRRGWIRRIRDHDGEASGTGGLEQWLALACAVGLDRAEVESLARVLPGARRACDAYVDFVRDHDLLEAVAASLTELWAGALMGQRIADWEKHYPWVKPEGLAYFRSRTRQAPVDAQEGLAFVLDAATTEADQARCVTALETKCRILWALLDAVEAAHARLRLSPAALLRREAGLLLVVLPERAVRIDASGSEILARCDGTQTAEAIAEALRLQHGADPRVESDVHEFLTEMERVGVLARAPAP